MSEKRDIKRYRKRFQLKFGTEGPSKIGFTEDVSMDGLFIKTTSTLLPGTKIAVELLIPNRGIVKAEGTVRWIKRAPPNLIHLLKKCGMGIRINKIVSGMEAYASVFSDKSSCPDPPNETFMSLRFTKDDENSM